MTAVEFIQLVEQYPCIYNSELPDYARKETTEKAWQEVANYIDWTVTECKEKWKNIRNGFVRSLKPAVNGVPKKPYYLFDVMQFVLPYINPSIQIDKRRIPGPMEDLSVSDNETIHKPKKIKVGSEISRQRHLKRPSNDIDRALISWLQSKKPKSDDPRKMFLLSLLPDVKNLTEKQLGLFRIKVLLLLEEVKEQTSAGLEELLEQCRNTSTDSKI